MDERSSSLPRWTPVFDRIPDEKRKRVLESAKSSFARYGFAGTNVNHVAESAGISVGSLYKYFRTKEDLFLAIIEESHALLETTLNGILESRTDFFERVEAILRVAVRSAQEDPDLIRLYVACTTEELSGLAERLTGRIESVSASLYTQMVADAAASGQIIADADPKTTAFCLDDLFLLVQFSYASSYYKDRLQVFVGDTADNPEVLIAAVLKFIRRSLKPR